MSTGDVSIPRVTLYTRRGCCLCEDAKRVLASGLDPSIAKKQAKIEKAHSAANTFEAIANELLEKKRQEGNSPKTLKKAKWLLGFAFPAIGSRPIKEINAREILGVLRTVEARGRLETARRLRATIGEVFRYRNGSR